jgi:hypothetical protein
MHPAAALLAPAIVLAPPSGRPPTAPLERVDPRIYDVGFEVSLVTTWQYDFLRQENFRLGDTPIVMPVIFQGSYSMVQPDSLRATLWLEGREDPGLRSRTRLDEGYPFGARLAVMPIEEFSGKSLRWRLDYRVQVWSSRLHGEEAAAAITWPREWPSEVRDGLQPQMFIESDAPAFAAEVNRVSGGKLRLVPPYLAAKDLVRHCLRTIRVGRDGEHRGIAGVLQGLNVQGAAETIRTGLGSPHDLVCVCVAMLRAAGIPARPVIGIQERLPQERPGTEFVSWAELYLPGSGWLPFDPMEMRGSVANVDVRRPWREFGTMDDLNLRVPLSYHFVPPAAVESPMYPAVWGWDPRPARISAEQQIKLHMWRRGDGVPDPGS